MINITEKEIEINEWELRKIPELMQIPVNDFVIWYHETKKKLEESQDNGEKDFLKRELQWLETLIELRYKDRNQHYRGALPNIANTLKNEVLNPLVLLILKMSRKYKINIINKDRIPKKRGILYISNHVSFQDIQILKEIVGTTSTVLGSNDSPGMNKMQKNLLKLIGGYLFDRRIPEERKDAKEFLTTELAQGRNGILFPEAIHNRTESIPILPMHWGFIDIVKDAKTDIIPVILNLRDGNYDVNVGNPIRIHPCAHPQETYEQVRNAMATLRWEIWESFPMTTREKVLEDGLEIDDSIPWDINHEKQFMYNPYDTQEKVFAPIEKIKNR